MDNIKDVVCRVIGSLTCKGPQNYERIHELWREIMEDKTGQHTRVAGVRKDQVLVMVDSSAWLYQMNLEKESILNKLKKEFPEIQSILFKIGKVKG